MKRLLPCIAFAVLIVTAPAFAQDAPKPASLSESLTGDAKKDFDEGKVLFEDGDFAGAGKKFEKAYERSKDARLLWNIAVCEKGLHHYVKVRTLVDRFLSEGKDAVSQEQRDAAKTVLDQVKPFIGSARIDAEPDVQITIDGEPSKPGSIPLDLGAHKLTAEKPGHKPYATTITVEGGAETVVPIALVRIDTRARIVVHAGEGDSIAFDDRVVGVTRWQGDVDAGSHSLRVSAPKRKTYELQLDLAEGSTRTVEVTLESQSLPLWPFIAGGVVLAGAAAIGGYFLFKPDARPGAQTPGTLAPGFVNLASVFR